MIGIVDSRGFGLRREMRVELGASRRDCDGPPDGSDQFLDYNFHASVMSPVEARNPL